MATETAMVNILLGHRRPEKIFTLVVSAAMSDEKFFTLQDSGWAKYYKEFWEEVADTIKRKRVTFLGGDFNMSLFVAKTALLEYGIDAAFCGSYAWRQRDTRGGGEPGLSGCRYDSLGLFAVAPVMTVTRLLSLGVLRDEGTTELDIFQEAQGYKASAYLGGESAILEAFQNEDSGTRGGGDAHQLPKVTQKALKPEVWDAPGGLLGRGAHMPLLFYVGVRGSRSEEALVRREQNMITRGWGPASSNRGRLMQQQGKGKGEDKGKGAKGKDAKGKDDKGKGKDAKGKF